MYDLKIVEIIFFIIWFFCAGLVLIFVSPNKRKE